MPIVYVTVIMNELNGSFSCYVPCVFLSPSTHTSRLYGIPFIVEMIYHSPRQPKHTISKVSSRCHHLKDLVVLAACTVYHLFNSMRAKVCMYIVKLILCMFYSLQGTLARQTEERESSQTLCKSRHWNLTIQSTSHVVLLGTEENPS
jgi:hypothetical protein